MGIVYASCGDEIKKISWNITLNVYNKKTEKSISYLSVCPVCYHKYYKKICLSAERNDKNC